MAVNRDRHQRNFEEKEHLLTSTLNSIGEAVITTDREGRVLFVNQVAERLIQRPAAEAVSQSVHDILHIYDERSQTRLSNLLSRGEPLSQEDGLGDHYSLVIDSEQRLPISYRVTSLLAENSRTVSGFVIVFSDISERRELQQQLFQHQKMESIGRLAGGIAHDFNNTLTSILGFASFMKGKMSDHPYRKFLDTIEKSAQRAADLTAKLVGFAQGGKYNIQPLSLNNVINDTLEVIRGAVPRTINLETRFYEPSPIVDADSLQLQQVLLELCRNAGDAMPEGGSLKIDTRVVSLDKQMLSRKSGGQGRLNAALTVRDSGAGMNRQTLDLIFEPFFTTKKAGRGCGLGLAMVYGVIQNHGGSIRIKSRPGRGTTAEIFLPLSNQPLRLPPKISDASLKGEGETVLVVDDVMTVRMFAQTLLENYDYRILEAEDGLQAVELYQQQYADIDIVVLDMVMPRQGGYETFFELQKVRPDVKVLIASGHSETEEIQEMLQRGALGFIQKPYLAKQFLAKIRHILDAEKSG